MVTQYELTVQDGGITPAEVLDGGVSGDKGALRLLFSLADADADAYTYRIEVITATGGYDTTAPLVPQNGRVAVDVPTSWTVAGIATVRLVQLKTENGDEIHRRHYPPVSVRFAYRDEGDGMVSAAPLWQELITRADSTLDRTQAAALDALTAAEVARDHATEAAEHALTVGARMDHAMVLLDQLGNQTLNAWTRADIADQKADELIGQMGDIDTALEYILALQYALMGGESV